MTRPALLDTVWEYFDVIVTAIFFVLTMTYLATHGMEKALLPGSIIACIYSWVRFRK